MAIVALILSLFVAVVAGLGILSPLRLLGMVRQFQHPAGLYAAAILRVVLGGVLLLAVPTSRASEAVRILGVIIFVSGLITPLFGLKRFRKLINWWSGRGPFFMRVWAGFALAISLFLAYAVAPW